MTSKNRRPAVLSTLSLICMLGSAPAVMAQVPTAPNSPSAQNEWKGATSGLGSSHRFPSVAVAANHCGNIDPVVWSDGYNLTYYMPGSQHYGQDKSKHGFYACKSEADDAGFHAAEN